MNIDAQRQIVLRLEAIHNDLNLLISEAGLGISNPTLVTQLRSINQQLVWEKARLGAIEDIRYQY